MPVVFVEMWEGRSAEQKRGLVEAITKAMVEQAGADPTHLHVIIHDVPRQNWGRGGVLAVDLPDRPRQRSPAKP